MLNSAYIRLMSYELVSPADVPPGRSKCSGVARVSAGPKRM